MSSNIFNFFSDKFKNNNRKTSGGRNPELNQRGPGNASAGREKDSYRDVSSSSSSTTSTSTSSSRPRGGGPGYKQAPVPVTDNKKTSSTPVVPLPGQKIVWGKPVSVNSTPVVETASGAVALKTNVVPVKPAWGGSTSINNNTAVKADDNVPAAVKSAWSVQSTAEKTEDVETKKPATPWASIAAAAPAAPSTPVVPVASENTDKSEPVVTPAPVKAEVQAKIAPVKDKAEEKPAPVNAEVQAKPAPVRDEVKAAATPDKLDDVLAKPALSAKPGWAAIAASAPPFNPSFQANKAVVNSTAPVVVKPDSAKASAKTLIATLTPPVKEDKTPAVKLANATITSQSAPVLPVAEILKSPPADKPSPVEIVNKATTPLRASAPVFIPSFAKSTSSLPSAAVWANPGTAGQPEVIQTAAVEPSRPVPCTVAPMAPLIKVDVTVPPPKIERMLPLENAVQKEIVVEDAQTADKIVTANDVESASKLMNHVKENDVVDKAIVIVDKISADDCKTTPEKTNSLGEVAEKSSPKIQDKVTLEKVNSTGDDKSISSDEKPISTDEKAVSIDEKAVSTDEKPVSSDDKPVAVNDSSSKSGSQTKLNYKESK